VVSTRSPRLTLARMGLSATSNASSVIENSATRTGTMRLRLQMKRTSGATGGRISSVPAAACAAIASSSLLVGLTSASSTASCGAMPKFTAVALLSGNSSWSVASISASSLMLSIAGPLSRNGCERSLALSPPVPCTCSERDSASGLYCSEIMRFTCDVVASSTTRPPLRSLGLPGNELMGASALRDVVINGNVAAPH